MKNIFDSIVKFGRKLKPQGRGIGNQALQASLYFGITLFCATEFLFITQGGFLFWVANILSCFLLVVACEFIVSSLVMNQRALREIYKIIDQAGQIILKREEEESKKQSDE